MRRPILLAALAAALLVPAGPAAADGHLDTATACADVLSPGGSLVPAASAARGANGRKEAGGSQESELPAGTSVTVPANFMATVPVWFHVIAKDRTKAGGWLSDATIRRQMDVLNKAFAAFYGGVDTGFRFELAGVTRTVNAAWYGMTYGSQAERAAKQALRRGGPETLNMDSIEGGGLLGWAVFPKVGNGRPGTDGVVFAAGSVPGGSIENDDLGQTATHEVGHWLGLYHTFQNGCSARGDGVGDTPAMDVPTSGCPEGKDTCPRAPGLDPVHNHMDYSYDACYREFTAGQARHMAEQWLYFRAA
jgi:hypothetical protein